MNKTYGNYSSITAGMSNTTGVDGNLNSGRISSITGGRNHLTTGDSSSISGGNNKTTSNTYGWTAGTLPND